MSLKSYCILNNNKKHSRRLNDSNLNWRLHFINLFHNASFFETCKVTYSDIIKPRTLESIRIRIALNMHMRGNINIYPRKIYDAGITTQWNLSSLHLIHTSAVQQWEDSSHGPQSRSPITATSHLCESSYLSLPLLCVVHRFWLRWARVCGSRRICFSVWQAGRQEGGRQAGKREAGRQEEGRQAALLVICCEC